MPPEQIAADPSVSVTAQPAQPPSVDPPIGVTTPITSPTAAPPSPSASVPAGSHIVPDAAFKEIKRREREAGERAAMAKIDEAVAAAGFASLGDALGALAKLRQPAAAPPAPSDLADDDALPDAAAPAPERGSKKWQAQVDAERRRAVTEARRRKELEAELDRERVRAQLQISAIKAGVKDPDYALHLLQRHIGQASDLGESFDEDAWFSGLRTSHPYLFAEQAATVPATTGTGQAAAAPRPAQGEAPVDVRKMTPEQFAAHRRKLGLTA